MGCVASRIDNEERVRICKERKRLMKQLLGYRKEFADAQLAYLRSLRNTGVTLRQFTESENLEFEEMVEVVGFPPSPPLPLPLPPSPPPPPTFSPDLRKFEDKPRQAEEIIELVDEASVEQTPPPPVASSSWEYWDPFGSSAMPCNRSSRIGEPNDDDEEEEGWADTNSEFIEEDGEVVFASDEVTQLDSKHETVKFDGNVSMISSHTKDSSDMAMVVWRKKTLAGVIKEVDEYFLKASSVVKDIAVFIDIDTRGTFIYQSIKENKRKRSNSAKVISALSWSWSSKSLQSNKEIGDSSLSSDPCKPGAHCITLLKLNSEEQKLYKDVKEEEISKVEFGRKTSLLQRQEEEQDSTKAEKTRATLESLESYILALQESISKSRSTILLLINQELHPQLIALASGFQHTWRTMHKCHQFQNHISQQLNRLTDQQNAEPTTEYRLQAAAQLQTEVASWLNTFCRLVKFQQEYVRALAAWIKRTECLEDTENGNLAKLRATVEKWQQGLDKLPEKMVSEAIKFLQSAVHAVVMQQQEEVNARKRSEKFARKLEREVALLMEVEMKFAGSSSSEVANSALMPKHPLMIRRARVEALRVLADDKKAKYARSVKTTRTMTLNNLQTSLPKVFQALTAYSSACVQGFDTILYDVGAQESEDLQETNYGS